MNPAIGLEHRQKLDRGWLILAILVAVLFHLWLFYFMFPARPIVTDYVKKKHVTLTRRPPQLPKSEEAVKPPPPNEKAENPKVIMPVHDPTPGEPEPIQELQVESAEIEDIPVDGDYVWAIPDAPEAVGVAEKGAAGEKGTEEEMKVYNPAEVSQKPQVLAEVKPAYPEIARQARKEAVVILELVVDKNGDVVGHQVLSATGDRFREQFIKEAVTAAYKYKFKPAIQLGHPVACTAKITVTFKLK